MSNPFKVGQRVTMSKEGLDRHIDVIASGRSGVVVDASWAIYVDIRVDGKRNKQTFHVSFWEHADVG